ncbi:AEC family transporter [Lacticigenium naphthae]|uniref:AEC family transporter n=1 Tax=Lacticigenium naphthae TaxID=515351 RepID=UPI0003FC81B3|nr:hypothetical protein [Lacticigenium naphthae]
MPEVLIQAFSFLLVILIGYLFKRRGILSTKDGHSISQIIIRLTLPATIIIGFNGTAITTNLLIMAFTGMFLNITLIIFGGYIWKNKQRTDKALIMFGQAGYNIGNFTIPFVQGFLPQAIPYIGSFDIGNALMIFGGSPVLVDKYTDQNRESLSVGRILLKLFHSPPFSTYVVMFTLASFSITLPHTAIQVIDLFAKGNAFLAMFMVGLYLEILIPKVDMHKISIILLTRYSLAMLLALFFYFFLPLSPIVRLALILIAFAPIGTVSTINMVTYGNKESTAAQLSSISILISLILMTAALSFLL